MRTSTYPQCWNCGGTTTAAVWVSIHAEAVRSALQIAEQMGVRAIVGMVFMDEYCPGGLRQDPPADTGVPGTVETGGLRR